MFVFDLMMVRTMHQRFSILAAFETLGLQDWYHSLPEGLGTMLNTIGDSLSAGQAQLLVLTRVFLRQPDLVILDEASSRLDPATETLLDRALAGLLCNRTAIIIAHRLTTVKRVDEILVLDRGRICEHGSRQQLQADSHSLYASLLKLELWRYQYESLAVCLATLSWEFHLPLMLRARLSLSFQIGLMHP